MFMVFFYEVARVWDRSTCRYSAHGNRCGGGMRMIAARKKKKNNNNTHTHPPPHTHTHTIHLKWLVLGEEQWTKNKGVTQYDLADTENLFIHSSLIYSFDTDLQNT